MQVPSSFDRSRGIILMYHRVAEDGPDPWSLCVSSRHFAEHLEVLRRFNRPMRLQDLVPMIHARRVPAGAAVVTFDDGYAATVETARSLLERHDVPATAFLTTGQIGHRREFWWDELERIFLQPGVLPDTLKLSLLGQTHEWSLEGTSKYTEQQARRHRDWRMPAEPPTARQYLYRLLWERLRPLSNEDRRSAMDALSEWVGGIRAARPSHRSLLPEEVERLAAGGLVEVGAHSVTHQLLPALPVEEQRTEVRFSKAAAEKFAGRPVLSFSYPYGDYTNETQAIVGSAGFNCACSTKPGPVLPKTNVFALPRLHVENWDGEAFLARLRAAPSAAECRNLPLHTRGSSARS